MAEFNLTRLEKVISGPGAVRAIGAELEARGVSRAVIVTGASLARSTLLARVQDAVGSHYAGLSAAAVQHAPAGAVREIAATLTRLDADAIVSFGGGSAIDSAKVAAASRMNGRDMTLESGPLEMRRAFDPTLGRGLVHIAIPTTLSAGAFTPGGGVTDEASHLKRAVLDARLQPCVVIHDPELCVDTPDRLWISTGIRVLDHAIEAIYSKRAHPLSSALAARAIRLIIEHLPGSRGADPESIRHRGQCLDAAWLSLYGGFNTGLGLSHAVGHQIGPAFDIPHGITSCIALVPAMRFIGRRNPETFGEIAEALRISAVGADQRATALACADAVATFIGRFDVPTLLTHFGITRGQALALAPAVLEELKHFDTMRREVTLEEIRELLAGMCET
jgi:alcohol dehydrogenase class IV